MTETSNIIAAQLTLEVWRGNDEDFGEFQMCDADENPLNLTGHILIFSAGPDSQTVGLIHKRTDVGGSGFVFTNAATGKVRLTLTHDETRTWTNTYYEIEWRATFNNQKTILYGTVDVRGGVNTDG